MNIIDSMGPNLITFNKAYEKRLEEYKKILGCPLAASQVFEQWCDYLEYSVEPTGYYALWNVSRELCEEFGIPFPSPVLVLVELTDFKELTAHVKVTGVMDDMQVPEYVSDVPLQNLYPTEEQENNVINTQLTAECLDQYRIFYNHLWWPWDVEEIGETSDWVTVHLENRLQLYFDMLSGEMDYEIGGKIRHYMKAGREVYNQVKELEELINDEEVNPKMTENEALLLIKNTELDQIKNQLVLFENRDFREIESRKKQETRESKGSETTVVMPTCSSQDAVNYMGEFEKHFCDTRIFRFCSDPQEAVSKASPGDSIVIAPGTYSLNCSGSIEEGGSIIGMIPDHKPVLKDGDPSWSLLEFSGDVRLNNLEFEIQQVHAGIIVRRSTLTLQDVKMKSLSPIFSQAIVVLKNTVLEANNCSFDGFNTAIVANEGATVLLNSCSFENNNFAIKVSTSGAILKALHCIESLSTLHCMPLCEGADVTLNSCGIYSSKVCAIQVESGKQISQISSMELLKTFPGVKAAGLTVLNSSKGDVQIVKRRHSITLDENE